MAARSQSGEGWVHIFGAIAPDGTVGALLSQLGLKAHSFSTDFSNCVLLFWKPST